jgi:hypothetical protein
MSIQDSSEKGFYSPWWDRSLYAFQIVLLLTAGTLIGLKVFRWNYSFDKLIPETVYELQTSMSFEGYDEPARITTYLPQSDGRQQVVDEQHSAGAMRLSYDYGDDGRRARWEGNLDGDGRQHIIYNATIRIRHTVYRLPEGLERVEQYPPGFDIYLEPTKTIQSTHPTIQRLYRTAIPDTQDLTVLLREIHKTALQLKPMPFKGLTDAVTAARLGEASCNGKSRLFVALARQGGIPARLVGGIILTAGTKRTSHQWVEVYANGHWVPFDPLNDHFAELPANFLTVYRGDQALFSHSPGIGFRFAFKVRKRLRVGQAFRTELEQHPFNAYEAWRVFDELGIPLSLLNIIMMIPVGAFIISIFRNVIGLETFGTFLPALIAAASRETGLAWGLAGFMLVILVIAAVHYPLERWRILHNPKMGMLMILVVALILSFAVIGARIGLGGFSYISLFPIAVLTITAERFALSISEMGWLKSLRVMANTLLVIACAFLTMNSLALQSLFLAFPELYLVLIVLNLWLGRWIGLRMVELGRFRWLTNG